MLEKCLIYEVNKDFKPIHELVFNLKKQSPQAVARQLRLTIRALENLNLNSWSLAAHTPVQQVAAVS